MLNGVSRSSLKTVFLVTKLKKDIFLFFIFSFILMILGCFSYFFIVSATSTGVETLKWPWFCHRREHFLLIIVSEVWQTYQQNGPKLRTQVFLSATIFCKHFDMLSKLMRYKNSRVVFNFPSSLHEVVSSSKHRLQSILCIKTCKVLVNWVVKQFFFKYFTN